MSAPRVVVAVVLSGAALLAGPGCGGGGSGPTHAQYTARAERVCRVAAAELRAPVAHLAAAAGDAATLTPAARRALVPDVRRIAAAGGRLEAALRGLKAPEADRARAAALVEAVGALRGAVRRAGDALAAGRLTAALGGLANVARRSGEARQAAEDLGLTTCADAVAPAT